MKDLGGHTVYRLSGSDDLAPKEVADRLMAKTYPERGDFFCISFQNLQTKS
jgi:hypothetical protein